MFRKSKLFIIGIAILAIMACAAWKTARGAEAYCQSGTAKIGFTFDNKEPAGNPHWAMNVIAKDLQSGQTLNLGTIEGGQSASGTIDTGRNVLSAGKIEFSLTWSDGSSGVDKVYADYGATENCNPTPTAPPPTTPPPTETPTSTPTLPPTDNGFETATSVICIDSKSYYQIVIQNVRGLVKEGYPITTPVELNGVLNGTLKWSVEFWFEGEDTPQNQEGTLQERSDCNVIATSTPIATQPPPVEHMFACSTTFQYDGPVTLTAVQIGWKHEDGSVEYGGPDLLFQWVHYSGTVNPPTSYDLAVGSIVRIMDGTTKLFDFVVRHRFNGIDWVNTCEGWSTEVKVNVPVTPAPFTGNCEKVMEGQINCNEANKIHWQVGTYSKEDPGFDLFLGSAIDLFISAKVTVNGQYVTDVHTWQNSAFEGWLLGDWTYAGIKEGDIVSIIVTMEGLTIPPIPVSVDLNPSCGNPQLKSMVDANDHIHVRPCDTLIALMRVLQYEGSYENFRRIWYEQNGSFVDGVEYVLPEQLKKDTVLDI